MKISNNIFILISAVVAAQITNVVSEPQNSAASASSGSTVTDRDLNPSETTSANSLDRVFTRTAVELSLVDFHLINRDCSKFHSIRCTINKLTFSEDFWRQHQLTEVVFDGDRVPRFAHSVVIFHRFDQKQSLSFVFWSEKSTEQENVLVLATCSLGELVQQGRLKLSLKNERADVEERGEVLGHVTIGVKKLISNQIMLDLKGKNFHRDERVEQLFGVFRPVIEIHKQDATNVPYTFVEDYEASPINDSGRPTREVLWKGILVHAEYLHGDEYDRDFLFVCWSSGVVQERHLVGQFRTTLRQIVNENRREFDLINPTKLISEGPDYQHSGQIEIINVETIAVPRITDYIRGGLQLRTTIAIDFSAILSGSSSSSTRQLRDDSLVSRHEKLITSFATKIEDYNKMFSLKGFGARLDDGEVLRNYFNTDLSESFQCVETRGILEAYSKCLDSLVSAEPSYLAPVIEQVVHMAAERADNGENYFILVILADRNVKDLEATLLAISNAISLPISIIIVGMSNQRLQFVDSLIEYSSSTINESLVETVHYVPFSKYHWISTTSLWIAKEILTVVEQQVLMYMKSRGYKPKSPTLPTSADKFSPEEMIS